MKKKFMVLFLTSAAFCWNCASSSAGANAHNNLSVSEAINSLRGVQAHTKSAKKIKKRLDDAWRALDANKDEAQIAVEKALREELAKSSRDNYFMLDTSSYLFGRDNKAHFKLVLDAMTKLDAKDPVITLYARQLFQLVHALAATRSPEVIPIVDTIFLSNDYTVFIAEHAMSLDSTMLAIFSYGLIGKPAEEHLVTLLAQEHLASKRIVTVLGVIGSPENAPEIAKRLRKTNDPEEIDDAIFFLFNLGGEDGKKEILSYIPPTGNKDLGLRINKLKAMLNKRTRASSFEEIAAKTGKGEKMSPEKARERLKVMIANNGQDDETNPMSILESELPVDELVLLLKELRQATFLRVSDEALSDVLFDNYMINALAYK